MGYAMALLFWATALPEELVKQEEIDVHFQPGEIDLTSDDWTEGGVVSGWKIRRLDGEEYSKHTHEQLAGGNRDYTITFARDACAFSEEKEERKAKVQVLIMVKSSTIRMGVEDETSIADVKRHVADTTGIPAA